MSLKFKRKPAVSEVERLTKHAKVLDDARRACAQVDGTAWDDVTNEDLARFDAYFRAVVGVLPEDVIERLAQPEWLTWEIRVKKALRALYPHVDFDTVRDPDRAHAFRALVAKVKYAAERRGVDADTVLRDALVPGLRLDTNPAAVLANYIPG